MKIALFGYGKMGQLVEQVAKNKGHTIASKYSRNLGSPLDNPQDIAEVDLAIDFSASNAVLSHLNLCLSLGKPIVIGTTGWEEQLPHAQSLVNKANGTCLYAPNFSLGLFLFQQIMTYAASLFQSFEEYDVSGIEQHHKHKKDQPSGTAKALIQSILNEMPRLKNLDFSTIRSGFIPGIHTLQFDSPHDTIIFTHQARNKMGFAEGAIMAAEWLLEKKGFYTMNDVMNDTLLQRLK